MPKDHEIEIDEESDRNQTDQDTLGNNITTTNTPSTYATVLKLGNSTKLTTVDKIRYSSNLANLFVSLKKPKTVESFQLLYETIVDV
ncbi:MAG: hypothetical protein M1819_003672 [Sarea resinae]|nr:MAG: hypothetical protein M1819_003672 [Sarea resinae]